MKNILILNAGTRNTLVRDFIKTVDGRCNVVLTDNYILAPALYESDYHYVTKRWDEEGYWEEIEEICKKEKIGLVISLVDPELELLAKEKQRLEALGACVSIADEDVIRRTYDKYDTLEFVREHGYPWIKSYCNYQEVEQALRNNELSFPVITKPRRGSGSVGIEIVNDSDRLRHICQEHKDVIIQEYVTGQELGVDVYVDLITGDVVSIFAKKKLKMRAGETDKSVSFKDEKLFQLITSFVKEFGLKGVNDIDVFEYDGEYYISESNPRFGGGYIHAYAAGVDFPQLLINNMLGIQNDIRITDYQEELYMMKYFDIKVRRKEELQ